MAAGAPRALRRPLRCGTSVPARSASQEMGWPMGLEPTTTGITTLDSTFELRPPLRSCLLACPTRLELVTPSLEGWCSIRLSYGQSASKPQYCVQKNANSWSGREDLNLRHLAPKASALPGCATPRKLAANDTLSASSGQRGLLATGGVFCYKSASLF